MSNANDELAVQHFVDYLRIKTVQPLPDYEKAFEFLQSYAMELDLNYQKIQVGIDRHVAILTWLSTNNSQQQQTLLLNSHIDVVPVFEEHWKYSPFGGEIVDGRIYGRGAQDMKCVGIQYLEAIRRLKLANYKPNRTVHCLFVPDEEIGGLTGMNKFIEMDEFKQLNVGFTLDEGK
ncbi:unnamed protein product [Didymodactylos carnosus]|uniref:Aminoacylase-1 n=1 Tax=Didymodactylos carnosus TaxID=1234261 RepID=A0A815FHD0_9BILA|nr:unnamed protein product [Didymodactylos carnosus]CAF1323476.1 unnamed protein product [Didymodactylos carnosus]CAF3815710.1 unnamed protein product [Didymodactylos carnosus]CAF4171385.1 unnamed protein product [Didymodactylos carnosus]